MVDTNVFTKFTPNFAAIGTFSAIIPIIDAISLVVDRVFATEGLFSSFITQTSHIGFAYAP